MTIDYRVLGRTTVRVGGAERVPGRRRERDVLAVLLAAGGGAVPADRLLEELWGERGGTPAPLQVAVSRLRRWLDPGRSGEPVLRRTPVGYELAVARDSVDAWVFEDLAARALTAPTAAERLLVATRACELWHGEPFPGCTVGSVRTEAGRLVELAVAVRELRAEALADLGHPAAAVRVLAPLAPEHPYREQLWALLARAQFACARQADALATLAAVRTRLAQDLGVDPSPCLREMERRILGQDPALAAARIPVPTS